MTLPSATFPGTARASSPEDIAALFRPFLDGHDTEHFAVLVLSQDRRPLGLAVLAIGGESSCVVDPRQVFRFALSIPRSAAIIVAHNHPSGSLEESRADRDVFQRLQAAGRLLDLPVQDSLILTDGGGFASLAACGL